MNGLGAKHSLEGRKKDVFHALGLNASLDAGANVLKKE